MTTDQSSATEQTTALPPPNQVPVNQIPVNQVPVNQVPAVRTESAESRVRTWSGSRFEPDALLAAGVGLVLTVIGLIAMIRAGFSGPMNRPVVEVLGFSHTTTLGMIEFGFGLALLMSGASRIRSSEIFFGVLLGVAGFVGAVQNSSFQKSLALETSLAWLAALAGAVIVVASLILPRYASRRTTNVQRQE